MNDQEYENFELIRKSALRAGYHSLMSKHISHLHEKKKNEKNDDEKIIQARIKSFEQGYQFLMEEIKSKAVEGFYSLDPAIKPISLENFQIQPDDMVAIKDFIAKESPFSNKINMICNFSSDVQLLFYEITSNFYEQALYEKAIHAFTFLTLMNPGVQSFWTGLGLAYEQNLNIHKAMESYQAAIKSEPSDFSPYYKLIRCCEKIKDYSLIEELLKAAEENDTTKEQAKEVMEYLKINK